MESDELFVPMKLWVRLLYLSIPIAGWFLWGAGIGVSRTHLILRGFGTKRFAWDDIAAVRRPAGLLDGVIKTSLTVTLKSGSGIYTLPVHQTENPKAILDAISARCAVV